MNKSSFRIRVWVRCESSDLFLMIELFLASFGVKIMQKPKIPTLSIEGHYSGLCQVLYELCSPHTAGENLPSDRCLIDTFRCFFSVTLIRAALAAEHAQLGRILLLSPWILSDLLV